VQGAEDDEVARLRAKTSKHSISARDMILMAAHDIDIPRGRPDDGKINAL
jgi:hypothetical protein